MAKDLEFTTKVSADLAKTARNDGALKKLIEAWNSKNAKSAKRLGSFGFMAAALAACGGGSSTPASEGEQDNSGEAILRLLERDGDNFKIFTVWDSFDKNGLLALSPTPQEAPQIVPVDGVLTIPEGETFVADISLFDVADGGVAVNGDGNLWLLALGADFTDGSREVTLEIELNGGTLTFDMPSDDYTLSIADESVIDLNGGKLVVSDGNLVVSVAEFLSWNVGDVELNSSLVLDFNKTNLSDGEITGIVENIDATGSGNLVILVEDDAQAQLIFEAMLNNETLSGETDLNITVQGANGASATVDELSAIVDAKIAYFVESLKIELEGLDGAEWTEGDFTTLKTLSDALNELREIVGETSVSDQIIAAIGSPSDPDADPAVEASGLFIEVESLIAAAVTSLTGDLAALQAQIEGEGFDEATYGTLAELSAALDALTTGSTSVTALIGSPSDPDADPAVEASGLFIEVESLIAAAVTSLTGDLAALQAQIEGEGFDEATYGTLAELSAALDALTTGSTSVTALIGSPSDPDADPAVEASGLFIEVESLIAAAVTSLTGDLAALQAQIEGEGFDEATYGTLAELSAALDALTTGSTSVTALIGSPSDPDADPAVEASGLFIEVESLIAAAVTSLTGDLAALQAQIEGEGFDEATYGTLAELSAALDALTTGSTSVTALIGSPSDPDADPAVEASGLFIEVESLIAAAVTSLTGDLAALQAQIEGEGFDEATYGTLAELSAALDALTTGSTSVTALIGSPSDPDADPAVEASGLFIEVESLIAAAVTSLTGDLAALQAQIEGEGFDEATYGTLAELSAALDALTTGSTSVTALIGSPSDPDADPAVEASGLFIEVESLIAAAVTSLTGDLAALQAQIEGEGFDEATYGTLAELSAALDALTTGSTSVTALIGSPSDPDADPAVEASGLFIEVESLIAAAVTSLTGDLAALQAQIEGEGFDEATYGTLAELSAALDALNTEISALGGTGTDISGLQSSVSSLETAIQQLQSQIDAIVAPTLIEANELDNHVELFQFESDFIRVDLKEGDDTINSFSGDTEIIGGAGADVINLTFKDDSTDKVVYQSVSDGQMRAVSTVTFTDDSAYYREGSVLTLMVNGSEYSYTVTKADSESADPIAAALQGLSAAVTGPDLSTALIGLMMSADGSTVEVTRDALGETGSFTVPAGSIFMPVSMFISTDLAELGELYAWLAFGVAGGQTYQVTTEQYYDLSAVDSEFSGLVFASPDTVEAWLETQETTLTADDLLVPSAEAVNQIVVDGSTLKIYAEFGASLTVEGGGDVELAIENPGMVTSYEVTFPSDLADWPTPTNGDNTTEFDRQISITINDGEPITAAVVYNPDTGAADPVASVAALAEAINEATISGIAVVEASGTTLTLYGSAVPQTDLDVPTFTVDAATLEQNGVQQETLVRFSSDDADYYEGGTLSVTIAGEPITVQMVAGDAAASIAALKAKIDGTAKYETTFEFSDDLSAKSSFDVSVNLTIDGQTFVGILKDLSDIDDAIDKLNAEFVGAVEFEYDAQNNQVTVSSATEPVISDGISELVFGLPSAGSVVTSFGWTDANAPVTTDTIMTLDGPYNIAYEFAAVNDNLDSIVYGALDGFTANKTVGGNFYTYTQENELSPTVGEYITWLEGQDRVASVELASDGLSLTITAEPGYNAKMYSTNFVTELGGMFGGTTHVETSAVPDTDSSPYNAVQTSALSLGLLESVEQAVLGIQLSTSVDTQSSGSGWSYPINIDGEFWLYDAPVLFGVNSGDSFRIDSSLPRTNGFVQFDSVEDFIASLTYLGSPTGRNVTEDFNMTYSDGVLLIEPKDSGDSIGVRTFTLEFGTETLGTDLLITAATEEPDPLQVAATLGYEGEYQQATLSLEDAQTYSDGIATTRGTDVYYEGGQAHLTVTGAGEDGVLGNGDDVTVTVSVDMVLSYVSSTITVLGDPSPDLATNIAAASMGETIALSIDGVAYDTTDLTAYLTSVSRTLGTDATFTDLVNWLGSLDGVASASMVGNEITIDFEPGVEGAITDLFINRYDPAAPSTLYGSLFASAVTNDIVTGDRAAELTSQALVDEINASVDSDNVAQPAVITIEGDFVASDALTSEGETGLKVLGGSWGFINGSAVATTNADGFYIASGGNPIVGDADTQATLGLLLEYLVNAPGSDIASAEIVNGNIVLTSLDTGSAASLQINFNLPELFNETDLSFGAAGADPVVAYDADLAAILSSAAVDGEGGIILTAAEIGKETFEIDAVTLDYQGIKQIATVTLDTATTHSVTQGDDAYAGSENDRLSNVYFEGGKAYLTITPDGGEPVTVSADMAGPREIIRSSHIFFTNENLNELSGEDLLGWNADGTSFPTGLPGMTVANGTHTLNVTSATFNLIDADGNITDAVTISNYSGTVGGFMTLLASEGASILTVELVDDWYRIKPVDGAELSIVTTGIATQFGYELYDAEGTFLGLTNQSSYSDIPQRTATALADAVQAEIDGTPAGFDNWDLGEGDPTNVTIASLEFAEVVLNDVTYDIATGLDGSSTFGDLVANMNAIDGLTVSISDDGDGTYSLVATTDATGADATLEINWALQLTAWPAWTHSGTDGITQGADGDLTGIIGAVSVSGTELTLEAANVGEHSFSVTDATLDYQGVQQIATIEYDLTETFFSGGTLSMTIDTTPETADDAENDVLVESDMVEGSAADSIAALVAAVQAEIDGSNVTGEIATVALAGPSDGVLLSTSFYASDIDGYDDFAIQFFITDESSITTSFTAGVRQASSNYYIFNGLRVASDFVSGGVTLENFVSQFSGQQALTDAGVSLSYDGLTKSIVVKSVAEGDFTVGIKVVADDEDNIVTDTDVNGPDGFFTDTGVAASVEQGALAGIVGSVSESDGVITLTSAENTELAFTISGGEQSYEGVLQEATLDFSTDEGDYFEGGSLYAYVNGTEYSGAMVAGNPDQSVTNLMNDMYADLITDMEVERSGSTIILTAKSPEDDNTVIKVDYIKTDVAPVTQVTEISLGGLVDKTGYNDFTDTDTSPHVFAVDDAGNTGEISVDIAGVTVTAQMGDTVAETAQNLADRIVDLRDGTGEPAQGAVFTVSGLNPDAFMQERIDHVDPDAIGQANLILTGATGGFNNFDTSNLTVSQLVAQIDSSPYFTATLVDGVLTITTVAVGSGVELYVDIDFPVAPDGPGTVTETVYGTAEVLGDDPDADIAAVVGDVTVDGSVITVSAKDGGADPLEIGGFTVDTPYIDGTEHEVTLQFSNTYLDSAAIEGETLSVTLNNVTSTLTVDAELLSAVSGDQSEYIVGQLLAQIIADHQALDPASSLDLEAAVDAQTGNVLQFVANVEGVGKLDTVTAAVTKEDGGSVETTAVILETIDPGYEPVLAGTTTDGASIYSEDGEGTAAVTGRDQFTASTADGDFSDGDYGLSLDEESVSGEDDVPIDGYITNPSDDPDYYGDADLDGPDAGVDQDYLNPENGQGADTDGDASFYGDDSLAGGEGIDQTFTNPDSGYTSADNSPDAGSENGGDADLYGSDAGYYDDDGLNSDFVNGAVDNDEDAAYDVLGERNLDLIEIAADGDGGVAGASATDLSDADDVEDGLAVDQTEEGFAQFDWNQSIVTVLSSATSGFDVVNNFQAGLGNGVTFTWTGMNGYTVVGSFTYDVAYALDGGHPFGDGPLVGVFDGSENFGIVDMEVSFYDPEQVLIGTYAQVQDNGNGIPEDTDIVYDALNFAFVVETGDIVDAPDGFDIGVDDGENANYLYDGSEFGVFIDGDLVDEAASDDPFAAFVVDATGGGSDLIALEGELAARTLDGQLDVVAADPFYFPEWVDSNAVVNGTSFATTGPQIIFDWVNDYDGGRIEIVDGQFLRFYDTGYPDGDALTRFSFGYGTEADLIGTSYDTLDDFLVALNGTQELGRSYDDIDIVGSVVDGNLVLTLNEPYLSDFSEGDWRIYNSDMVLEIDAAYGTAFDLSTTEFGLVSSVDSDLDVASIEDATEVAGLLNSVFDFAEQDGGTTDNGLVNTTVFAVTASDDASVTAIWAHTQSSSGDNTLEEGELSLLATVNTIDAEFSYDDFAIWTGAEFETPILSAPMPV